MAEAVVLDVHRLAVHGVTVPPHDHPFLLAEHAGGSIEAIRNLGGKVKGRDLLCPFGHPHKMNVVEFGIWCYLLVTSHLKCGFSIL
jgi:hypothetical protein